VKRKRRLPARSMAKRHKTKIPVYCPSPLIFGEGEGADLPLQPLGDKTKTKLCSRCKQTKSVCEFNKHKSNSGGLESRCRDCMRLGRLLQKAKKKIYVEEKRCRRCGEVRPRTEFIIDRHTTDGLQSNCRQCSRATDRERVRRRQQQKLNLPDTKRCSRCGRVKSHTDFHVHRSKPDGLRSHCKQCRMLERQVKYAVEQADKLAFQRGPGLESWEQVESAIREMAELQVLIDKQKTQCDATIEQVKADTARLVKPHVMHQARLESLIERFIKQTRRTCGKVERSFAFGSVCFVRNRLDLRLNSGLAKRMLGTP